MTLDDESISKGLRLMVAIDFSDCSRNVLRQAKSLMARESAHIIALHVINHDFITDCIRHKLGDEGPIKKSCFLKQNQSFEIL